MTRQNYVELEENLGTDPKVTYNDKGMAIATMPVAITEKWEDQRTGEKKEKTTWVELVCFGKVAESVEKNLTKGKKISVEGKLSTNVWDGDDGKKHSKTQVKISKYEVKQYPPKEDEMRSNMKNLEITIIPPPSINEGI